ncbi:MAG: DUF2489 domain-containing protein [Bacteroidota bacterium]|nr:DUF2489 domain-containing protein [Kiloniellaceae bacterium]
MMQDKPQEAIEEILEICRGLLDDSIPVVEGCRRLTSLRHQVDTDRCDAFDTFIAVDSETDHLPFGEVRAQCSSEWLETADAQIGAAERLYREPVHKAADALLRMLLTEVRNS